MKKWIFCQGKYHYSEDGFEHYESLDEFLPGCEEEKNEDIKVQIKIFTKYKEPMSSILWKELNDIRKELQKANPNISYINSGYGSEFEVFAVSVLHQLTYKQAIQTIVHGAYDGKVDAIVEDNTVVYVYQIKMDKLSDPNLPSLMRKNIEMILNKESVPDTCLDLKMFLDAHPHLADKRFVYHTVSDHNTSVENYTPDKIFTMYFNNILLPHEKSKLVLHLPIERHDVYVDSEPIKDSTNYVYYSEGKQKPASVFIFVNAEKLVENLNKQGITSTDDRLFYDNIRGKLGENKPMRETIENHPEKFVLYNNGLSIIGEWKQSYKDFTIENPSFINGQQTLFNLLKAKEDGKSLSQVTVPIFIKNAQTTEVKQNIAFYNNSQRAIKEIDLLSLQNDLREIQKYLLEKAYKQNFDNKSYFLKIISSGARESDDFAKKLFKKENIIPLSDFVRLYWILDKKEKLGDWKNNISRMIRKYFIDNTYIFSAQKGERVCELIVTFNQFLATQTPEKRKIYKNCDIAFMYLINSFASKKTKRIIMAQRVIDYINDNIYKQKLQEFEKAKLIDLYKSNDIENYIKEAKKALGYQ